MLGRCENLDIPMSPKVEEFQPFRPFLLGNVAFAA